jgi:hypothetical protein
MNQNGKEKDDQPGAESESSTVRRGEESLELHADSDCNRTAQTESSSGEFERIGVCGTNGEGASSRGGYGTDGEVVDDLIRVTQECISALESSLEAGKAYIERLQSIRAAASEFSDEVINTDSIEQKLDAEK